MESGSKESAVAFIRLASSGNVKEAYSRFVAPGFKHHNPYYEESREALMKGMEENARQNPNQVFEVKRIIGDDEYVVVHSHVRQNPNERGVVVVHIFKFDNGRIEELWEVGQPVPEKSPNKLGMF